MTERRSVPSRTSLGDDRDSVKSEQVEVVMAAARTLVAMIAATIAELDEMVTVAQLRVLVLTSTQGPLTLGAVATELGVHPSNATRTVDRLVTAALLHRRHALSDRRQIELTLTEKGRVLVDSVMSHRPRTSRDNYVARCARTSAAGR